MKKTLTRILVLVLVLAMLTASTGALAESYAALSLKIGGITLTADGSTYPLDAALLLNVGINAETGSVNGDIGVNAGETPALHGGFNFDGATLSIGLDGMTSYLSLPAADLLGQLQQQAGSNDITALIASYIDLVQYASTSEALQTGMPAVVEKYFGEGYNAEATYTLEDGTVLTGESYDFSLTYADMIALWDDIMALDPVLAEKMNTYFANIAALNGQADLDINAELHNANPDLLLEGTSFSDDNGDAAMDACLTVKEEDETTEAPFELLVLNRGEDTLISFATIMNEDDETMTMTLDATAPQAETADFTLLLDIALEDEDGEGQTVSFYTEIPADATDYNFLAMIDAVDKYDYEGTLYESDNSVTVTYKGDTIETESGLSMPGVLSVTINADGSEVKADINTELAMRNVDGAIYTMNGTPVDPTQADEETLSALGEEAMSVVMNGVFSLMSAPGLSDLLGMAAGEAEG